MDNLFTRADFMKISQLEVEILGIQDMKGMHNFGDSVTSFILLNCVILIL